MIPELLAPRRVLWLALALMLLLWAFLPRGEGAFDDWWINAALHGEPTLGAINGHDFFAFADGNPAHLGRETGPMPWFVDPQLKLALFRPLSVVTHRLDHATFGFISTWASVHSLLWAILMVVGAFRLYARLLSPKVAGLAVIVFALAGSHSEPLVWLSARNALVAAAFGVWSILFYVQGREGEGPLAPALAWLSFVLALLSGESALGILGYFAAYELFARRDAWSARLRAFAPFAAAAVIWLAAYAAQGYGTRGSGYYLNPINEPLAFFAELPMRFAALIGGVVMGAPTMLWFVRPESRILLVLLGVFGVLVLWVACVPRARRAEATERASLVSLGVGALLSLVPPSAGILGARSLVVPSLGVSAWVAYALCGEGRLEHKATRIAQGFAAALLVLVHLVASPATWILTGQTYAASFAAEKQAIAASELGDLKGKRVLLLCAPDPAFSIYLPSRLAVQQAGIVSWNPLSLAPIAHRMTRTSEREFEFLQVDSPPPSFEQIFRGEQHPLRVGESVDLGFMRATVRSVEGRWRKRTSFALDVSLDDPSLVFLAWQRGALRRVAVPKVGESVTIPFEKGPWTL